MDGCVEAALKLMTVQKYIHGMAGCCPRTFARSVALRMALVIAVTSCTCRVRVTGRDAGCPLGYMGALIAYPPNVSDPRPCASYVDGFIELFSEPCWYDSGW